MPTGESDTTISLPGPYSVTVDASSAARSVTLSGTDATLAVEQVLEIGTTLSLSAGTLALNFGGSIQGGIIVANGGEAVFNGGTLDGVTYQGTLALSAPNAIVSILGGIALEGPGGVGPGAVTLTGAGSELAFDGAATLGSASLIIGGPLGATGALFSTLGNFSVADDVTSVLRRSRSAPPGSARY